MMANVKDLDHELGFWIEGAAYLWAPGDTLKECKRFYILQQHAAALFDKNNNILDIDFINTSIKGGSINPHELFGLFPNTEAVNNYMLSNCFLVWVWDVKADGTIELSQKVTSLDGQQTVRFFWTDFTEIRIEGESFAKYPCKKFPNNLIRVVSPEKQFSSIVQSYPWRFGNPYDAPPFDLKEPLVLNLKDKKFRSFRNLAHAQKQFNLSKKDIKRIHIEALRRALHRSTSDSVSLTIHYYLNKLKASVLPDDSGSGWEYNNNTFFADAHILYETLIEKRPVYIWRDITVDSVENRLRRLSTAPRTLNTWTSTDLETDKPMIVAGYAVEENKQYRESMEDEAFVSHFGDAWFAAVLDGHGGDGCSKYFAEQLPLKVFEKYDRNPSITLASVKQLFSDVFLLEDNTWFDKKHDFSGSTFTGVFITPEKIYTINLGDSRCVLELSYNRISETVDHKPDYEEERINATGSYVSQGRVHGILAVSRAFGDIGFKFNAKEGYRGANAAVSPIPDVKEYCRADVKKILIACDGVFDVMSSKEAIVYDDCEKLIKEAVKRKSTDNITAMILKGF